MLSARDKPVQSGLNTYYFDDIFRLIKRFCIIEVKLLNIYGLVIVFLRLSKTAYSEKLTAADIMQVSLGDNGYSSRYVPLYWHMRG